MSRLVPPSSPCPPAWMRLGDIMVLMMMSLIIINADSDDKNDNDNSDIDDDDNDEKVAPAFVSSSGMEPGPPSPLTTAKTRGNMRGNISGKSKLRSATIICTYMKKVEFKYI